jgi:hypothetical protein
VETIRTRSDVLTLARGVLIMVGLLLRLSGSGLAIDLARSGVLHFRPTRFDINAPRHLTNIFSRACNQLTGVVFVTVAFVVPLTANMYSLKFLEFFIRDRVNATVLTIAVLANLTNTLLNYLLKDDFIPIVSLHVQLGLVILGFARPPLSFITSFASFTPTRSSLGWRRRSAATSRRPRLGTPPRPPTGGGREP